MPVNNCNFKYKGIDKYEANSIDFQKPHHSIMVNDNKFEFWVEY